MIVAIRNRRDALIWREVEAYLDGRKTARQAAEDIVLAAPRAQADYWLSDDALIDLLRRTDPSTISSLEMAA